MRKKYMRWKNRVFKTEKAVRQKKYTFAAEKSCSLWQWGRPGLSRALEPALACVGRLLLHLSQRRVCFLEKNTKLETQIRLLESLAHNFPSEFGTLATIVFKASSNIDATEHSKCWQVRRENLRGGEGMQRGFSSEFNGMRSEPAGYGLATTWKKTHCFLWFFGSSRFRQSVRSPSGRYLKGRA